MRGTIPGLLAGLALGLLVSQASAQGLWGRGGGRQGIQASWNNHSRLQGLGTASSGSNMPAPRAEASDLSPRGLARSLLWPFGSGRSERPQATQLPVQPWPAQPVPGAGYPNTQPFAQPGSRWTTGPAASGAPGLPGAVQMPAQLPPTAYQMPTSVYHQWTPQQASPALYQRSYPPAGPSGVVPAQQMTQVPPRPGYPSQSVPTPGRFQPGRTASPAGLPGRSIQPQVVGTVNRQQLEKPSWWQRFRNLWPFGR